MAWEQWIPGQDVPIPFASSGRQNGKSLADAARWALTPEKISMSVPVSTELLGDSMSQYLSFDTTTAEGFAPIKPPSQKLAAVKTVQTIDGYVGQAIYEGQIVWQSERTYKTAAKALRVAEAHVTDRVASLLA